MYVRVCVFIIHTVLFYTYEKNAKKFKRISILLNCYLAIRSVPASCILRSYINKQKQKVQQIIEKMLQLIVCTRFFTQISKKFSFKKKKFIFGFFIWIFRNKGKKFQVYFSFGFLKRTYMKMSIETQEMITIYSTWMRKWLQYTHKHTQLHSVTWLEA